MSPSRSSVLAAAVTIPAALVAGVAAAPPDAPTSVTDSDLRGCSSRPEADAAGLPDFGLALDGEMVGVYDLGEAANVMDLEEMPDVADIEAIDIVCWAAVERIFGVRVRAGITSVWTYDPFEGSRDFLREAYVHVQDGGDVSDLVPPNPELTASREDLADGHFHLELRHPTRRLVCLVSTEAKPEQPGARPTERAAGEPGEPYCTSLHDHGGSGA